MGYSATFQTWITLTAVWILCSSKIGLLISHCFYLLSSVYSALRPPACFKFGDIFMLPIEAVGIKSNVHVSTNFPVPMLIQEFSLQAFRLLQEPICQVIPPIPSDSPPYHFTPTMHSTIYFASMTKASVINMARREGKSQGLH